MSTPVVTRQPRHKDASGLDAGSRHAPGLTAGNLAALLRAAGLPCVTLTTESGAAAEPASAAGEGLRIVEGSFPVRVHYAVPTGTDAAITRRGSHLMWLAWFAEEHRWSVQWLPDGWMTVHPEPWPATYVHNGGEVFRKTGRPADEDLGSHVVLRIAQDPGSWADAIEAEVAAEIARKPKGRRLATWMQQQQRLDGAARIRADGPGRSVDTVYRDEAGARARAVGLQRNWPDSGVRYEAAPVTATAACTTCFCPMIRADGQWWHHTGGYPAGCRGRKTRPLPLEPGDWEIAAIDMTCGYCGQWVSWPETQRSWAQLTGVHSLGVHRQTAELVVLAEVTGIAAHPGEAGHLAHHCTRIPDSVRAEYAADIRAVMEGENAR